MSFNFRSLLTKTITALLSLILTGLVQAQVREPISDFKLITPNAGWVVSGNNLLWTDSAGSAWSDITPSVSKGGPIHGVFFLNTTSGWVLLTEPSTNNEPASQLQLMKTFDAGQSWSTTSFRVDGDDLAAFAGTAHIFFVDPLHGWIMLRVVSSSNFKFGLLFMTSDGGSTWTKLPSPPIGEPVYFATATDGWLAGGPNGDALFVTRNGGSTWSKQQLPAPPSLRQPSSITYTLPRFATMNDGLIQATFASEEQILTTLYQSHDGGATWTLIQAHQSLALAKDRSPLVSSLLDRGLIVLSGLKPTALTVVSVSEIQRRAIGAIEVLPEGNVTNISFVDENTGLFLVSSGHCIGFKTDCVQENRLVVTQDGARSFLDVTPDLAVVGTVRVPHASLNTSPEKRSTGSSISSHEAVSFDAKAPYSPASVITIQNKEGFDKCEIPAVSQMQTWWNSSPYRAVAFYIGGAHRSCGNTALNATWVSSVAAIGWGFIPIWVGPQANTGRFNSSLVNTDLSSAEQQGTDEASAASDQATILGLSSQTIVYYDMETGYDVSYRGPVQAFVNGWVQGMHAKQNKAGVYSSHPNFQYWTPTYITNVPDAIWFAWFFQNGVSCGTTCHTVFGVPDISDSLWTNDQRTRQTSSTIDRCWSSVCFTGNGGIDEDWVDGPAATLGGGGGDTIPPTISSFTVTPDSIALGNSFSIQAEASDSGGSGLSRIELWRAPDAGGTPGTWNQITYSTLSGNGPTTVPLSDAPSAAGMYWYGIHVFDTAGNQTNEPNGPVSRTVSPIVDTQGPSLTISSPTDGASVTTSTITVSGTASDSGLGNTGISSVTVNGMSASGGTASGPNTANWSAQVTLSQGLNPITVIAKDASSNQNSTTKQITITLGTAALPTLNLDVQPSTTQNIQVGQQLSFTATVRDNNNNLVSAATIGVEDSICALSMQLSTNGNGTASYTCTVPQGASSGSITFGPASKSGYNNSGSVLRQVNVVPVATPLPDLVVTSLTASNKATAGGQINISATVVNQGTLAAGAFSVEFYFSATPNISAAAVDTGWFCSFSGLDVGESTACTGPVGVPSSLTNGTWYFGAIADPTNQITEVSKSNNARVADSGSVAVGPPAITLTPPSDFDGNGVPDLVWQNDSTRQVLVWYMGGAGGATVQSYAFLDPAGHPGWHVVTEADFDGNGVPDLVWQNDSTAQVLVWYMSGAGGATVQNYAFLDPAGHPGWHVVAAADFNGDGVPDLVWQNDSTRQVLVWYMGGAGGATMQRYAFLDPAGHPGWHVVAAADFDGDGVPDLVWQNDSTRQVLVWYMGGSNGATLQDYAFLDPGGHPGWHVVAAADFNGYGTPDLVWQNDTTRQVLIWYMGGTGGATMEGLLFADPAGHPGWSLVHDPAFP